MKSVKINISPPNRPHKCFSHFFIKLTKLSLKSEALKRNFNHLSNKKKKKTPYPSSVFLLGLDWGQFCHQMVSLKVVPTSQFLLPLLQRQKLKPLHRLLIPSLSFLLHCSLDLFISPPVTKVVIVQKASIREHVPAATARVPGVRELMLLQAVLPNKRFPACFAPERSLPSVHTPVEV